MSYTAKDLIAIAVSQIGYHEKASNSNLDDNTANSGSANYTKYARDLANAGYYGNSNKNGYAWCDVFVDWCFYQLTKNASSANDMECQTGPLGAGCTYSAGYYKNQGRFYTSNPKPGDQIFFIYNGSIGHTGIVETVSSTTITTIEGNTSDMVARRTYSINNSSIAGYGRPKYSDSVNEPVSHQNAQSNNGYPEISYGDVGVYVKKLQEELIKRGYSCGSSGADADFGPGTLSAVKKFQSDNNLTVDGIVGRSTWSKLADGSSNTNTSSNTDNTPVYSSAVLGADDIWKILKSMGFSDVGAAALMGNMNAESCMKSNNLEDSYQNKLGYTDATYTSAVDSGKYTNFVRDSAGYGLCQWTYYTRKEALYKYAKSKNASIGDTRMQLEFLVSELKSIFGSLYNSLMSGNRSLYDLSTAFMCSYENPANQTQEMKNRRFSYCQSYYNKYTGTSSSTSSGEVITDSPLLRYGSKGNEVKKLQEYLISLGYDCGSCGADGDFGRDTVAAVKRFQTINKLVSDGIVGTATWDKINSLIGG